MVMAALGVVFVPDSGTSALPYLIQYSLRRRIDYHAKSAPYEFASPYSIDVFHSVDLALFDRNLAVSVEDYCTHPEEVATGKVFDIGIRSTSMRRHLHFPPINVL